MNQDGKFEQVMKADPNDSPAGKLMLTLCTISDDASGYQHAIIPFPPSYEAACAEAIETFAAYIPKETKAVSLRQAVQRKDGQYVWSIIRNGAWDTILEKSGEEVGVFLSDISPQNMLYNYQKPPPKKLISLMVSGYRGDYIQLVSSFQDCEAYVKRAVKNLRWTDYQLNYDKRMVGTEVQRNAYREGVGRELWSVLANPELFEFLSDLYPEPMRIQVLRATSP